MKKTYIAEFWYNADLRGHKEVEAWNEVTALAIAIESMGENEHWVTETGFSVNIRIAR